MSKNELPKFHLQHLFKKVLDTDLAQKYSLIFSVIKEQLRSDKGRIKMLEENSYFNSDDFAVQIFKNTRLYTNNLLLLLLFF